MCLVLVSLVTYEGPHSQTVQAIECDSSIILYHFRIQDAQWCVTAIPDETWISLKPVEFIRQATRPCTQGGRWVCACKVSPRNSMGCRKVVAYLFSGICRGSIAVSRWIADLLKWAWQHEADKYADLYRCNKCASVRHLISGKCTGSPLRP